jgi:hypothetical protein
MWRAHLIKDTFRAVSRSGPSLYDVESLDDAATSVPSLALREGSGLLGGRSVISGPFYGYE